MNKRKRNFVIFLFMMIVVLMLVGCFNFKSTNTDINATDKKIINQAEQCIDFYNKNKKMPQMLTGDESDLIYDSEHLMLKYNDKSNKKNIVVVANYKNDLEDTPTDIWDFVDLFQDTNDDKINQVIYVYKDDGNKYTHQILSRK